MDYVILSIIGLVMGVFGGLLGIGGSSVMIPAMMFAFGQNQHLYQASAMLCNFFVAVSAVVVHHKAKSLTPELLKWLLPMAVIGIILGVTLSNASFFAGDKGYLLARCFGAFLVYVAIYNCYKLYVSLKHVKVGPDEDAPGRWDRLLSSGIGAASGIGAGLLGIGAGTMSTPFQQLFLKMPLRNAMSNSAAMIMSVALIGGVYKTLTLGQHGIESIEAVKIAGVIIPTAMVGGYIGGHLMHKLPSNVVRVVFIGIIILASYKMLTAGPSPV